MCLFNAIMDDGRGKTFVRDAQLAPLHPGANLRSAAFKGKDITLPLLSKSHLVTQGRKHNGSKGHDASLLGAGYRDEADDSIYAEAKERFERDCAKYNVSIAACPVVKT